MLPAHGQLPLRRQLVRAQDLLIPQRGQVSRESRPLEPWHPLRPGIPEAVNRARLLCHVPPHSLTVLLDSLEQLLLGPGCGTRIPIPSSLRQPSPPQPSPPPLVIGPDDDDEVVDPPPPREVGLELAGLPRLAGPAFFGLDPVDGRHVPLLHLREGARAIATARLEAAEPVVARQVLDGLAVVLRPRLVLPELLHRPELVAAQEPQGRA